MPHPCQRGSAFLKTRLPQHQGRLDTAGGRPTQPIAYDTSTVIILYHCQPRPPFTAILIPDPNWQQAMICLPDLIWPFGFSSIQQIIFLPIRLRPLFTGRFYAERACEEDAEDEIRRINLSKVQTE